MITQTHPFQKQVDFVKSGGTTTTVTDPDVAVEFIAKSVDAGTFKGADFSDAPSKSYVLQRLAARGYEVSI
jgi:hypothetical protein